MNGIGIDIDIGIGIGIGFGFGFGIGFGIGDVDRQRKRKRFSLLWLWLRVCVVSNSMVWLAGHQCTRVLEYVCMYGLAIAIPVFLRLASCDDVLQQLTA